jgi:hypothetical protein
MEDFESFARLVDALHYEVRGSRNGRGLRAVGVLSVAAFGVLFSLAI